MADSIDIDVIIENLVELLTNTTNMTSVFYDIFLNPVEMDVTLKQYNDENELVEVTIPNRAKDRRIALSGTGSPEGMVTANVGTCYVDDASSTVYFKITGSGNEGWTAALTAEALAEVLEQMQTTIAVSGSNIVLLDKDGNITSSANIGDISANKSLSNLNATGTALFAGKANTDLSNLSQTGKARIVIKQYLDTDTYLKDDVVAVYGSDGALRIYQSLTDGNTGNAVTDTSFWKEISLGGNARNLGEIVTSSLPLTDATLHETNGDVLQGDGIYEDFTDYMSQKYYSYAMYAMEYAIGTETYKIYTKDERIAKGITVTQGEASKLNTTLYNEDGSVYKGNDFVFYLDNNVPMICYTASGQVPPAGKCSYISFDNIYTNSYPDVKFIGSLQNDNGVLSGFTTSDYVHIDYILDFLDKPWSMKLCVRTSNDVDTWQFLTSDLWHNEGPMEIWIADKKFSFLGVSSTYTVLPDTLYYLRASFTGTEYTLEYSLTGEEDSYTTIISFAGDPISESIGSMTIGVNMWEDQVSAPWLGYIDLNECSIEIDGETVWRGIMPIGFATEYGWQGTVDRYGVCGKYVYDIKENTVRLPKITGFIEGASVPASVGEVRGAGLPGIYGEFSMGANGNISGAFKRDESALIGQGDSGTGFFALYQGYFNANDSNIIYGNSDTVQPQSTKVYYYVTVATGVNKNVTETQIDQISADLANKLNRSDLAEIYPVIETYRNGTSWYRIYSDGWCEQGSYDFDLTRDTTIYLMVPYADTDYFIGGAGFTIDTIGRQYITNKTTSSFETGSDVKTCATNSWWTAGYIR